MPVFLILLLLIVILAAAAFMTISNDEAAEDRPAICEPPRAPEGWVPGYYTPLGGFAVGSPQDSTAVIVRRDSVCVFVSKGDTVKVFFIGGK